jgi:hypothetical protein
MDIVKYLVYNSSMNCPLCNEALVEVVYGFPTMEMIDLAKNDKIVLGGCPKPNVFRPTHFCYSCLEQYPQNEPEYDKDIHTPMFSHNN